MDKILIKNTIATIGGVVGGRLVDTSSKINPTNLSTGLGLILGTASSVLIALPEPNMKIVGFVLACVSTLLTFSFPKKEITVAEEIPKSLLPMD